MRILAFSLCLIAGSAMAQTAGDATRGNIPPGTSQDGSRPADGAIRGGSTIAPGEKAGVPDQAPAAGPSERLARCNELSGVMREQCLDKERSAAGGSSARLARCKELTGARRQQCLDKERSAAGGSSAPSRSRSKEAPVTDEEDLKSTTK